MEPVGILMLPRALHKSRAASAVVYSCNIHRGSASTFFSSSCRPPHFLRSFS